MNTIAQENDHLKLEVKRLEQMVSELVKKAKVRPSQDNHRNMVNKLKRVQLSLSKLSNN
jgi:cell division protein FtsB